MNCVKAMLVGWTSLFALQGVAAQGQATPSADDGEDIAVVAEPTLLYPSVGQMNDHMHARGELMVGVRLERSRFGGASQSGTRAVSNEDIEMAGYMMRGKSMTMDMLMLDLMYAPSDSLTLTLSPQYVWNRMVMVGFPMDPMAMPMEMVDESDGFGDTFAAASYRLADSPRLKAHATLGVWIPTGSVDAKNDMGKLIDYSMQLGSGTWDLEPSLTVSGTEGRLGWGAQASYRLRLEGRNESGFRFGDRARVSGWLSYLVAPTLGLTARAEYSSQGRIEGAYNAPAYNMMSPADRPFNYGGHVVTGAIGANWQIWPEGPQLGAEFSVPLHQNLNGIQLPQDWRMATAIRQMF